MPPDPKKEINQPLILLAEGEGDAAFFRYLLDAHGIPDYQVESVEGKDNFGNHALGLTARPHFHRVVEGVLLVGDSDDTPDNSFNNIRRQLGRVHLPQPNSPREKVRHDDRPYFGVLMLPYPPLNGSRRGCIETLLLPAAIDAHPEIADCARQFLQCVNVQNWSANSKDKLLLRCLLSGAWQPDPNASLKNSLNPERGLIPLNHGVFQGVREFLGSFRQWLNSQSARWDDWKAMH